MVEAVKRSRSRAVETEESAKDSLQRQMDEARESISQTVTDIKDTVVEQYNSVKESVTETLDWREQFRSHPVVWCFGALSVGYVLGNSVLNAFTGAKGEDKLLSQLAALGDRFTEQLSKQGMSILAPALTGTILVPVLTSKISELTGVDLSEFANQLISPDGDSGKAKTKSKKKKKTAAKKQGRKKKKKA
jgi:predicted phage tail protein